MGLFAISDLPTGRADTASARIASRAARANAAACACANGHVTMD